MIVKVLIDVDVLERLLNGDIIDPKEDEQLRDDIEKARKTP